MDNQIIFNRVLGLKFLYENFPYLYRKDRIKLYFVKSKKELMELNVNDKEFDILVLKRSANKVYKSDINYKDNRFFKSLQEVKEGSDEFDDIFDFCVECHKFKNDENYYSDKLAIAQFSTELISETPDMVSFIPSFMPGVNTRENKAYMEIVYQYDYANLFQTNIFNKNLVKEYGFNNYQIHYLANEIHRIIDNLKEKLLEIKIYNQFQLIIRVDSYLNLLLIDFRTPDAWAKINI